MDFCIYFKTLAKDPYALAPPITVREFIKARLHILTCKACKDLVGKIAAFKPADVSSITFCTN